MTAPKPKQEEEQVTTKGDEAVSEPRSADEIRRALSDGFNRAIQRAIQLGRLRGKIDGLREALTMLNGGNVALMVNRVNRAIDLARVDLFRFEDELARAAAHNENCSWIEMCRQAEDNLAAAQREREELRALATKAQNWLDEVLGGRILIDERKGAPAVRRGDLLRSKLRAALSTAVPAPIPQAGIHGFPAPDGPAAPPERPEAAGWPLSCRACTAGDHEHCAVMEAGKKGNASLPCRCRMNKHAAAPPAPPESPEAATSSEARSAAAAGDVSPRSGRAPTAAPSLSDSAAPPSRPPAAERVDGLAKHAKDCKVGKHCEDPSCHYLGDCTRGADGPSEADRAEAAEIIRRCAENSWARETLLRFLAALRMNNTGVSREIASALECALAAPAAPDGQPPAGTKEE